MSDHPHNGKGFGWAMMRIMEERQTQDMMWGEQNHDLPRWATILGEEYGEVCKAILSNDREGLRVELVQVAAVAVAVLEYLDRQDAKDAGVWDVFTKALGARLPEGLVKNDEGTSSKEVDPHS